jgi:prepilin-type N-terminal cleavage/methylation domain-containing protein
MTGMNVETLGMERSGGGRGGFTLVEILVTLAVASVLMVALMQSFVTASESWGSHSKYATAQREARAALRLLADDLSSAVALPPGGAVAGLEAPRPPQTQFLLQAGGAPGESSRVAFFRMARRANHGLDAGRGELRLVLYGAVISDDGLASGLDPEARSQKLARCEMTAEETQRRLMLHRLQGRPLVLDQDWQLLENPNILRSGLNEPTLSVLAHDLILFELRPMERVPEVARRTGAWVDERMPPWVEVNLRVTNRQTGRWLRTLADWRGQGELGVKLHNNTPEIYHDDPEVRTFSMRLRMPSETWPLTPPFSL